MATTSIYEQLINEIKDEDEKKVFDVLLQANRRVTREELVKEVYGVDVDPGELASSVEDRKIRKIIQRLRERDYPIVSSSGTPGYTMKASPDEMDTYIAELASRKERLQDDIDHGYRSKEKARMVKECRESFGYRVSEPVPVQLALIVEA